MGLFFNYILYPLLYLISISPSWLLYRISDLLFVIIYYIVGYRKKVVLSNLENAFQDKDKTEIHRIARRYYQYLCDLLVEAIKTITMSEAYVHKHVKFHDIEKMNSFFDQGKSIILVMGHLGNWELAGPSFSLNCKHQLKVVYSKLSNPFFEELFSKSRTKFSTRIVPKKKLLRSLVEDKEMTVATALIADQAPSDRKSGQWLQFFDRDTLVHTGTEKVSKLFGFPVVYMHVQRIRRGYYEITPTVLFEEPQKVKDYEITKAFFTRLEQDIKKNPETWLWSHRRWKHQLTDI